MSDKVNKVKEVRFRLNKLRVELSTGVVKRTNNFLRYPPAGQENSQLYGPKDIITMPRKDARALQAAGVGKILKKKKMKLARVAA